MGAALALLVPSALAAASPEMPAPPTLPTIACESAAGAREHCSADTSAGVSLVRTTGTVACLLGRNWGYDDAGVWVSDGCSGEFFVGTRAALAVTGPEIPEEILTAPEVTEPEALVGQPSEPDYNTWGLFDPGKGFLIGRNELGEASMSAYALLRQLTQTGDDTFTDHLGEERPVDLRNDLYSHRVIVFLKGWMGTPKLRYDIAWWTVNTTDQDALFANLAYMHSKRLNVYAGIGGNQGSRTLQGSHPYWLGHDRTMADEFFRPYFTQGLWVNGEILPGLWYSAMVGNTSSTLGIKASEIDRDFTRSGSIWWMPTTHEFGPRGAFGDWEYHEELATRFGFSTTFSQEERYTDVGEAPGNTALKLADSVNVFETGSLASGVTVEKVDYEGFSVDAALKYRGFFLHAEAYQRRLDNFDADGLLPVDRIDDWGFYVQTAFFPIPRKLELYALTSQIFGDDDAGFGDSWEVGLGLNWYPFDTRNHRANLQVLRVHDSPVSSTFGYYTGGEDGYTVTSAFSIFF